MSRIRNILIDFAAHVKHDHVGSDSECGALSDAEEAIQSVYGKMFRELKEHNLKVIEEHYGPRCKTRDLDDFPELDPIFPIGDLDVGRCPVCVVYERFDKYWEALT